MKGKLAVSYLATVLLGLAISAGAVAQARHDEKPHGESGKRVTKSEVTKQPQGGTRHDEKPHRPALKSDGEKK